MSESKVIVRTTAHDRFGIQGHVSRGFEAVREAFAENFVRRRELGGACCAFHRGEKVVDLWGGIRNKQTAEPWEQDTMVVVHSATKGLAAMTLAIAHSRGWLDYEERVCAYWPEFAQHGKGANHRPPTPGPPGRACSRSMSPWIAASSPTSIAWRSCWRVRNPRGSPERGRRITPSLSASTKASCCAASIRSIAAWDSSSRMRSRHGSRMDVYIRLPEAIPNSRLATLAPPSLIEMLRGFGLRFMLEAMNPRSNIYRALNVNPGTGIYQDEQRIYARNLEVPSGDGVGTARAIAHAYSVFATGGRELGLAPGDAGPVGRPSDSADARILRRMHEGQRRAVLAGLHEAEPRLAVRQRQFVRLTRGRRFSWLCRSNRRRRLRLRHEPDGDTIDRRPAGCGAQRRTLLRYCARCGGKRVA